MTEISSTGKQMNTRLSSTVSKALKILDLFQYHEEGLSVTQISALTEINMSTVVRLCATLEMGGHLQRNSRGIYSLGPQIERLAQTYRHQFDLENIVRPILRRLRDATGESASFHTIKGNERVCLFREDSTHTIRHVVDEGARLPLTRGAAGLVLLAFSGAEGPKYQRIRESGFLDAEGRESYTASVAAPVLINDDNLAGAIVVSGPAVRFAPDKRQKALELILESCKQLGQFLPVPRKKPGE